MKFKTCFRFFNALALQFRTLEDAEKENEVGLLVVFIQRVSERSIIRMKLASTIKIQTAVHQHGRLRKVLVDLVTVVVLCQGIKP